MQMFVLWFGGLSNVVRLSKLVQTRLQRSNDEPKMKQVKSGQRKRVQVDFDFILLNPEFSGS
jgi:hypothetical protein